MRVRFETFRSSWDSWESLFKEAAEFATQIEAENLITISHSADKDDGVVTVWYWGQ